MSEGVQILLDQILSRNVMLIAYLGVSLLLTETAGARTAMKGGLAIAGTLLTVTLAGSLIAGVVPGGEPVELLTYLLVSLIGIGALRAGGLLSGERYGIPAPIFILPLFFGAQYILHEMALDFELSFAAAVGTGVGAYLVYALSGSMGEQIRLNESTSIVKGTPAMIVALGLLALAMGGFQWL